MSSFGPVLTTTVIAQAALLLGGCAAPADRSAATGNAATETGVPARKAQPRTVLAFGDSLYAGYGLKRTEALPAAIEARLRAAGLEATVVNAGVSGETTAGGRARLAATLDRQRVKPDLVLLGLGANDALRLVDPARTRANLVAMLDTLQARRIPVVLTGMMITP